MGRRAQGWRIRQRRPGDCFTVVYWHPTEKRQVEEGTGTSDPERAKEKAVELYANAAKRNPSSRGRKRCVTGPLPTADLAALWLTEVKGLLDPGTIADYAMRLDSHVSKVFPSVLDFSTDKLKRYISDRLTKVQASTVRKDLSAVNGFLRWCVETKRLNGMPVVPGVPKRVLGTVYERASRAPAPELSPEEIRTFLDELPDLSERTSSVDGYWFLVRPRFEFGYETGLRPGTLDKLSVPDHWTPGSKVLRLSAKTLKQRRTVVLPLSKRAQEILEQWAPRRGLIFGEHDYRHQIAKAAEVALPEEKLQAFCAAHLRSARVTHNLDAGMSLSAAQWLATHKLATTTDRYSRASQRAAEAEMARLGMLT